jgi:hypothetical protein
MYSIEEAAMLIVSQYYITQKTMGLSSYKWKLGKVCTAYKLPLISDLPCYIQTQAYVCL